MEIFPGQGFKHIGGEDAQANGFCPTDYYIPTLRKMVFEQDVHPTQKIKDWSKKLDYFPPGCVYQSLGKSLTQREKLRYEDGEPVKAFERPDGRPVWGPKKEYEHGWIIVPPEFGFVAGCFWGFKILLRSRNHQSTRTRPATLPRKNIPCSHRIGTAEHTDGETTYTGYHPRFDEDRLSSR